MKILKFFGVAATIILLFLWYVYFLKTEDLFLKEGYFTKEKAFKVWESKNNIQYNQLIEPKDKHLLILAGYEKIHILRFQKNVFLWSEPSIDTIDKESIKHIKNQKTKYSISFVVCTATVVTTNPNISKVKIGKNDAELLPIKPFISTAKGMKLWYFNLYPDALDCQGPSGQTYTFYDSKGKVVNTIIDD
ncbi:hypothetical protein J6TS2_06740 [Heyndrickxia sporothermodurans]|nr:hypothetical protein J6TS2_06740 [Heyndrickxia sporothermodurans]